MTTKRRNALLIVAVLAAVAVGFLLYRGANVKQILYTHTGPLPPPELRSPAPEWTSTP